MHFKVESNIFYVYGKKGVICIKLLPLPRPLPVMRLGFFCKFNYAFRMFKKLMLILKNIIPKITVLCYNFLEEVLT